MRMFTTAALLLAILLIAHLQSIALAQSGAPNIDANCDGRVDNFDIDAFVLYITFPELYAQRYPGCNPVDNSPSTPVPPVCQAIAPNQASVIEGIQVDASAFFRRSLNVVRRQVRLLKSMKQKLSKARSAQRSVKRASIQAIVLIARIPKNPLRCNLDSCKYVSHDFLAQAISDQFYSAESALRTLKLRSATASDARRKPARSLKRLVAQKTSIAARISKLTLNSDECIGSPGGD